MSASSKSAGLCSSDFLGFQADDLTLYQGDDEHVEPLVAAHLRGLQAKFIEGRTYEAGVSDYLENSLISMRQRQVPEPVCEQLLASFGNLQEPERLRMQAKAALLASFELNEIQLTCLLFSPFINAGRRARAIFAQLSSRHVGGDCRICTGPCRACMRRNKCMKWMTDVSGLPVRLIVRLYAMGPVRMLGCRRMCRAEPRCG